MENKVKQTRTRINKRGRKLNDESFPKRKRGPQTRVILPKSVREDQIGHFAINRTVRGMCRVPGCKAKPVSYCLKCQIYLCNMNRTCFLDFHGVDYDESLLGATSHI